MSNTSAYSPISHEESYHACQVNHTIDLSDPAVLAFHSVRGDANIEVRKHIGSELFRKPNGFSVIRSPAAPGGSGLSIGSFANGDSPYYESLGFNSANISSNHRVFQTSSRSPRLFEWVQDPDGSNIVYEIRLSRQGTNR